MLKMYGVNKKTGRRNYLWVVSRYDADRLARAGVLYTNRAVYTNLEFVWE